ncbi:MAG: hypothetical protein K8S87_03925 [Planctomycetes bacterium]|nr:hypothetical protein [Planctomycetota bacterium]
MVSILDLINNEMPLMLSGVENYLKVILWMISGIIVLFTGLNYKDFFNRSNFDLILLVMLFPVCVLFFSFTAAVLIVGVFFTWRLLLRFADKEQHISIQLPVWVLVFVFIIGFSFTIYNIYKSDVSKSNMEYSIEVQDAILLGEMPYEIQDQDAEKAAKQQKLLPGPLAYYISYLPHLIAPLTTEINNEKYYLTNFDKEKMDYFSVPVPEGIKFTTFADIESGSKAYADKISKTVKQEKLKQNILATIEMESIKKVDTFGCKVLQIFALIVLLGGLFAATYKLASLRLAFFMMVIVLFLPWKAVLLSSTWHVLAIGVFMFAIFFLKRTWVSGVLFGIAVGINPILLITLPLFINYYMPNIAIKGYWLISLGIMVFGLIILVFAPYFNESMLGFMPTKIFGALVIFIGLAVSLIISFLGNPLKRAPGGFFFAFLIVVIISFLMVVMNSHANSITDSISIFSKSVIATSFITGASVLKTIAIPLFAILFMFNFLPRNIAQGGLIVLSAALMFFTIYILEIPMNGSEFILLLPALFISHLKGSMLAEDKLTSIRLNESIESRAFGKDEDLEELTEEDKLYGISDFTGASDDDNQDEMLPPYDQQAVELDDNGEIIGNSDDSFLNQNAEKASLMTTDALIEGLETEIPKDAAGTIGDMVEEVLEQKEKEEKEDDKA